MFLEKGQEKAKCKTLPMLPGISRTSLNYYFKTKENLFQEIIEQMLDGVLPKVGDVLKRTKAYSVKLMLLLIFMMECFVKNEFILGFFCGNTAESENVFDFVNKSSRIQEYLLFGKRNS